MGFRNTSEKRTWRVRRLLRWESDSGAAAESVSVEIATERRRRAEARALRSEVIPAAMVAASKGIGGKGRTVRVAPVTRRICRYCLRGLARFGTDVFAICISGP